MARIKFPVLLITAIALVAWTSAWAAPARLDRSVTELDNGTYLIKIDVASTGAGIYGLQLVDQTGSIVDVYAPRGWVAVTDGEAYGARTASRPIQSGKRLQFLVHSTRKDVQYTWSVHGPMKQIGAPGTLK